MAPAKKPTTTAKASDEKTVNLTSPAGTKVTVGASQAAGLKKQGYK